MSEMHACVNESKSLRGQETSAQVLASGGHDMDVILKAGAILMKSGAETYRVEDSMHHIAGALGVAEFEAYVVNRGIMASGVRCDGVHEAKVLAVPETVIDLSKIEAVNALSRAVCAGGRWTADRVYRRLHAIERKKGYDALPVLLAYFFGAGGFSIALESTAGDALVAALAGLMLGAMLQLVSGRIRTGVLLAILGSAVVATAVNMLFAVGLGDHRSNMLLGALMVMVPGVFFVNAIRELSLNNYSVGMSLLLSALLTCLSISIGVAAVTEIIPFADQLTGAAPEGALTVSSLLVRSAAAGVGTVAFALLYGVHWRYFADLARLGAVTWAMYLALYACTDLEAMAVLVPGLVVSFLSRVLAARRRCSMTIFLSTSIFPLIPGLTLYRAVYYLLTGANSLAYGYMRSCFVTAFTIAIAIAIVQQIPHSFFARWTGARG